MAEPQQATSWWQTLPGVLTALAGVITALSGLVALLYQNGVLGHQKGTGGAGDVVATQSTAGASVGPSAATAPTTSPPTPAKALPPAPKPWSGAVAVVVGRDGRETRLRADSLSNCVSASHDLTLASGQSVDFERMASFEVQHADPHTASTAKARLQITLLDGGTVSDSVDANCDLFGFNDVGRFATFFDQIRLVRFER